MHAKEPGVQTERVRKTHRMNGRKKKRMKAIGAWVRNTAIQTRRLPYCRWPDMDKVKNTKHQH